MGMLISNMAVVQWERRVLRVRTCRGSLPADCVEAC